ncbi:hypothetical protein [Daejeonella lutea]|uniref:Lipopolysaccharide assembly protein A domain-containing protein n=1 Tax=Daejeonella lutea TaxID=572036 RepID=A0A1T5AVP6_9SPHI|nr:hypothetical protein [Daejeonella lutea]SKB39036.1 hypothetical protein SAMN05661099_1060 [Daejeonella lutea]
MSFKTIIIVIISVLVTLVLMNNTDEVDFWLFGDARIPKLAILGSMFGLGLIVGFILGRPKKKVVEETYDDNQNDIKIIRDNNHNDLSDEDREYIR